MRGARIGFRVRRGRAKERDAGSADRRADSDLEVDRGGPSYGSSRTRCPRIEVGVPRLPNGRDASMSVRAVAHMEMFARAIMRNVALGRTA